MLKLFRIATTQLQCHRIFCRIKIKVIIFGMNDGLGGHHFRIKQGVPGKLAVEITAMARCPIQHRGNGEAATVKVRLILGHFYGFSFMSFCVSSFIRWRKRPAAM